MKIKEVIEDLKIKKNLKIIVRIVKIYLGLSLVVLWAVWGQFIFRQFLDPAYISQDLQAPSYVVGTIYRVLIYFTCHFQGGSLCFSFCLLVSSVSNFYPGTRGRWWTHFQAHLFSCAVGREGRCKQKHWRVLAVSQPHWVCPRSERVCFPCLHCLGSRLLCWKPLQPALGCMHFPGLSCSGSGTRVLLKGTDLVGPAFCALPRSEQLR